MEKTRTLRVVFQSLPDLPNGGIDAVVHIKEHLCAPNSGKNFLSRKQLASAFDQQEKHVQRDALQAHNATRATQLIRTAVQLEILKSINLR